MKLQSFAEVWERHNLSIPDVAIIAGVPYATVNAMLANEPVETQDARYVLSALSQKTGKDYSLETVVVAIIAPK